MDDIAAPNFPVANVSSVPDYHITPYPGSKIWMTIVARCWLGRVGADVLVDPFCGMGSIPLMGLING